MLPTFVIIGAMKSGTTSLHHYLSAHPEICMSRVKETDYFVGNQHRGRRWYESQFESRTGALACGESSPNYTKSPFFQGVAARMHAALPGARLIYLVRDPVQRIVSHYRHNYAKGKETRSLNAALLGRFRGIYLHTSRYFSQLKEFLHHYPDERVLVLSTESLNSDRRAALARVFEFLGVDPAYRSPVFDEEYFVTSSRFSSGTSLDRYIANPRLVYFLGKLWSGSFTRLTPPDEALADRTRNWLREQLQPEVEALRRFTGQQLTEWSL